MAESEDNVRRAAELKLWLETRIRELQEEIERLREALSLVDATLRASTFKPAIEIATPVSREVPEIREIKRDRGGESIATATITSDKLVIEPKEGISLRMDTPPFKSFLIGKILQGMRNRDDELVSKGTINKGEEIRFNIEEKNGLISRIIVENYRERARLEEILKTASWTFSRMLEK